MTQVRFGLNKLARLQAERADQPDNKLPVELEPPFPYVCLPAPIKTDFNPSTLPNPRKNPVT